MFVMREGVCCTVGNKFIWMVVYVELQCLFCWKPIILEWVCCLNCKIIQTQQTPITDNQRNKPKLHHNHITNAHDQAREISSAWRAFHMHIPWSDSRSNGPRSHLHIHCTAAYFVPGDIYSICRFMCLVCCLLYCRILPLRPRNAQFFGSLLNLQKIQKNCFAHFKAQFSYFSLDCFSFSLI